MAIDNIYARMGAAYRNEIRQQSGLLVGIIQGLMADKHLQDAEIHFLRDWLASSAALSSGWPGSVLAGQIQEVLADGVITEAERAHLVKSLTELAGGRLDDMCSSPGVASFSFDQPERLDTPGARFCLTGDFVYGPRSLCAQRIEALGGLVQDGITKKLNYLVVGGLGSAEWKHGTFGTKVEKAMQYRSEGVPLLVIAEDVWASFTMGAST